MAKILTVGLDILDGSFEVDFDYRLLSPAGEEPLRYEIGQMRLRRAGMSESLLLIIWLRNLLRSYLQDSGDVYLAIAKNEGLDLS